MSLPNLFLKNDTGIRSLLATPFKTEEEFERTVFKTPEILEDIFLIKRQIRGGNKHGIPDIIGVDSDGSICIIEMKNVSVDATIIPQVLQYAFWAESNPDSIKSLWLECESKPDDLSISWDSLGIRVIIIAPKIHRSTLDLVDKINYQVDLIEVNRWVENANTIYLVSRLEPEGKTARSKPARGLPEYDISFYKSNYNKHSVDHYYKYIAEVEDLIKSHGWSLETKYNKSYCGFKAGFFNAFGVQWVGSKSLGFFFKMSEMEMKSIPSPKGAVKYSSLWKQAEVTIDTGKTKAKDFIQFFEVSYKKLAAGGR